MPNQQNNEKPKLVTPQMVVRSHEKRVRRSLVEHGLIAKLSVHFPDKKRTPLMGQLGVWLVNKAGGIIVTKYGFNDKITSEPSPENK